jgi:F-type H+-transporting ATPase subunit epsilon
VAVTAGIPKHLRLEFVTSAQVIANDDVDEVQLPGEEGSFGVLPGHAPMLAALTTGMMWSRKGTEKTYAFIGAGFAEVLPDRVSILARVAERAEDIDIERAAADKRQAEAELVKPGAVEVDLQRARLAVLRATARLEISRFSRHRR